MVGVSSGLMNCVFEGPNMMQQQQQVRQNGMPQGQAGGPPGMRTGAPTFRAGGNQPMVPNARGPAPASQNVSGRTLVE